MYIVPYRHAWSLPNNPNVYVSRPFVSAAQGGVRAQAVSALGNMSQALVSSLNRTNDNHGTYVLRDSRSLRVCGGGRGCVLVRMGL
eukprot:7271-Eustigmatos_ZCMA.PRE.1